MAANYMAKRASLTVSYYLVQLMKKTGQNNLWFYGITLGLFYTKNAIVTGSFNFMS
jgi:hypothetical protein